MKVEHLRTVFCFTIGAIISESDDYSVYIQRRLWLDVFNKGMQSPERPYLIFSPICFCIDTRHSKVFALLLISATLAFFSGRNWNELIFIVINILEVVVALLIDQMVTRRIRQSILEL